MYKEWLEGRPPSATKMLIYIYILVEPQLMETKLLRVAV